MTSQTFLKVNLIIVFDTKAENVLMCHRQKNPYKGLYNFVGGKKNPGESDIEGAYRELFEESGITVNDIEIKPLFFTQYFEDGMVSSCKYFTVTLTKKSFSFQKKIPYYGCP